MKKIFITGASGYLGSSFIDFCNNKYELENFSLISQNIKDIDFNNIDIILHCAALVHQKEEHPYEKYHQVNVEYPVELAKLAKLNGVKQYIFISTIAVYGEDKEKIDENTICNPVSAYGKSKLEAEKELLKLNDDNFVISIIRPPMIYGENAPGNINSLVKLLKKVSILPLGGIRNKRSFIFILNLCHIINEIIIQQKSGIFLVCDDSPISTSKLCELVLRNSNKKIYLLKIPFFESLLKIFKPSFHKRLYGNLEINNTITRKKLILRNPYSIEEGIKFMIKEKSSHE
jgi:UDP-glucose 4-epimerase